MGVGVGWEWFLLGGEWRWSTGRAAALTAAGVAAGVLLTAGAVGLARRLWRRGAGEAPQPLDILLPAWLLSAPLLFLGHLTPAYHQYQLAALPALYALAGYGATLFRRWRGWRPAAVAAAIGVAAVQGAAFAEGLVVVSERLTPGGIGTPLAYPRAAVRALGGGEVVVHAHGDDPATVGDVAGFRALLWGRAHRVVDGRAVLLVPAAGEGARLLFTYGDLAAWGLVDDLDLPGERVAHPRRAGEPPYLSLTPDGAEAAGLIPVPTPQPLANGAALTGWRLEPGDGDCASSRVGRSGSGAEGVRYHQFHHLRTRAEGEPDAVHDVPLSSAAWRAGDTLYVVADLPAPPAAPHWVEVGMYTYPDVTRVSPEVVLRLEASE